MRRILTVALLLGVACSSPPPEPAAPTPESTALLLFTLADLEDPEIEDLAPCFALPEDDSQRAALLDALEKLASVDQVEVQSVQPLDGLDLVAVELTSPLSGGGSAHYSVQLAPGDDGGWTIRWYRGPGVEWPQHRPPRGEGLTTSSPPRDEGE